MEHDIQPELKEIDVSCPYCGSPFTALIDTSVEQQHYTEDCHICCSPIVFNIKTNPDGDTAIQVFQENE